MGSLSELVKKRLAEKRLAKPERIQLQTGETNNGRIREGRLSDNSVADSNGAGAGINSSALLASRDYEGARADLRTACILYVRARGYLYPGYMEKAFLVFGVLIDEEVAARWFQSYCREPYPDVCCCGNCCSSVCGTVRSHCPSCKGNNVGLAYDMQRLSQELGIHYSWIEYGFAWALSQVGGVKTWLN